MTFSAFWIEKGDDGFTRSIVERSEDDLPDGDVLIDVHFSSLNYKDGLSATGNPGVTRKFPHTPGIDAAGVVVNSNVGEFSEGDEVVAFGFDLGMNTPGGFGQRICVPSGWVAAKPEGLTLRECMLLGTAGITAALCVDKLEAAGMTPDSGPVLVTGATGGVGSVAVALLSKLGYEVAAVTGKAKRHQFLKDLGVHTILSREDARSGSERPLLAETYGGVVDTVGGEILFNAVKSLRYGCSLAACGLVDSPAISATVLPFILRHVNLLGVDSVELPLEQKKAIWYKLGGDWKMDLSKLEEKLALDTLSDAIDRILAGQMVGRGVLDLNA
ncbi:MAG: YhdH/YhfP family quinone oxidoreductase [Pseudomonadales bacterium]|jgi:alcohol dehydrogenase|nr:YhdH/YhfP family quinone oxidoreductase [Pseudomonadales bacterium]MDP6473119.1 YhdH/YhfP family quinone oxidoreductase [Pseudomonadales bacterium]MDP6826124.1 YhdH/YhfP family quinone oxidoreductase [Pseudomonadales bacterium]MDP6971500.1 YhdH/YhfP family quinone oxidoreductase [Pseudomonadales bacterium]|tara:strand:+ start:1556 stop:2542 length:987 start_codon:yes stop_codon:yes gene_type:complete